MSAWRLIWRTLCYYRTATLAICAGLAVATGVITGSLIIASSLEGSLLDLSLKRLGGVGFAAILPRPVSAHIAQGTESIALWQLTGTAMSAYGEGLPVPVTIWGVDEEFLRLQRLSPLAEDSVLINQAVSRDAGLRPGDEIALYVLRPPKIELDSLFARRRPADVMATLSLKIAAVLPDNSPGDFRVDGQSARPRNVFVKNEALARALNLFGQINVLVAPKQLSMSCAQIEKILTKRLTLAEWGLRLRPKPYTLSLQSEAFTLSPAYVAAALRAARAAGAEAEPASVYLATSLRTARGREISYALIAGLHNPKRLGTRVKAWPKTPGLILNAWAAADLQAQRGEWLTLKYLQTTPDGAFVEKSVRIRVLDIIPIAGAAADAYLVPEYEGLTDAETIGDWEPPFPVDMRRITLRDEAYWEKYKTTPKAFVSLELAQMMWGNKQNYITSLEIFPPPGQTPLVFGRTFSAQLLEELQAGPPLIVFRDLTAQATHAAQGATDFGQLFLALSFFIIVAGAGLAAMLVQLTVERRTKQMALLLALGLTPAQIQRLLLKEGLLLNVGGMLLGLPAGLVYAAILLQAMKIFWQAALGDTPALWLHIRANDLFYAAVSGLLLGMLTIVYTLREMKHFTPLQLWQSGLSTSHKPIPKPWRRLAILTVIGAMFCVVLLFAQAASAKMQALFFFIAGFLLLLMGLYGLQIALKWPRGKSATMSLCRLAWRSAAAQPRRSLLVSGLIAAGAFVIVATAASMRDFSSDPFAFAGPSGGFNLIATTQIPLPYDPATPVGRKNLGVTLADEALLKQNTIVSFLASPGDDLSCVNAARAQTPPLLAPLSTEAFIKQIAVSERFRKVRLAPMQMAPLKTPSQDEIVAYTDSTTLHWRLHIKSGEIWRTRDIYGRSVSLRVFAGFTRSLFAGYLLTSPFDFHRIYPHIRAPSFFLIETRPEKEKQVIEAWQRAFGDYGPNVRRSKELLAEYAAGENVYISMFLALGALGLLLGTVGLAVVTARNIIERQSELALMEAIGFPHSRLIALLALEQGGLLALGLFWGTIAALVAMLPALRSPEAAVQWSGIALALTTILIVGLGTNLLGIWRGVTGNILQALRRE